jgi:hypothetical protein
MNTQHIKTIILEAFNAVEKAGIGVREATAIDDYASGEDRERARHEDVEAHWWEIPEEWRPHLSAALSFTDVQGFRFLLPAAMTAALDGIEGGADPGNSVWFHLGLRNQKSDAYPPHHGHPPYIEFLRSISARDNADHFSLSPAQMHAVACFLDWYMQQSMSLIYCSRDEHFRIVKKTNASYKSHVPLTNYSLSVDDEMAIFDQECRIFREWLAIGGVFPTVQTG